MTVRLGLLLLAAAYAAAQAPPGPPQFDASLVRRGNSAEPASLVPGLFASIYGAGLGPRSLCEGQPDPSARETATGPLSAIIDPRVYPRELCGVRVLVDGHPAGLIYVIAHEIHFKVPLDAPSEGTFGLQVVYDGRASNVVEVKAGLEPVRLSFPQPAFTNMPIWVEAQAPPGIPVWVSYPFGTGPGNIGCNELQLRRQGRLLEPLPASRVRNGTFAGLICGSIALNDRHDNRLPLHLIYRIDEPGDYEVRLLMSNRYAVEGRLGAESSLASSEWTPLHVAASMTSQQQEWLAEFTTDPPTDPGDLLGDYLPSIVGVTDQPSLEALLIQLYHPHRTVRRYAELALSYWPLEDSLPAAQRTLDERGPSQALVRWLLERRDDDPGPIIEASLPYLLSNDPVLLHGAVTAVEFFRAPREFSGSSQLKAAATEAMIAAANHVEAVADGQAQIDYAQMLGVLQDERAIPILWRWADEGIAVDSSLRSIALFARPQDLPRLASLLTVKGATRTYYRRIANLPQELYKAYGADSVGFLEYTLRESDNLNLRRDAALALIEADRPAGWVFTVAEIEGNSVWKGTFLTQINAIYRPPNANEASILEFAKQRVNRGR